MINSNNLSSRKIIGRNSVAEAIKSGADIDKILIAKGTREGQINRIIAMAKQSGIPVIETDKNKLDYESGNGLHQGVVAIASEKEYCDVEDILNRAVEKNEKPFIIIAEEIEDTHNLGAIIRTADACGAHGIIIPKRHTAPLSPATAKSAAGALEYVNIARVPNIASVIEELKKKGVWIFGLDSDGKKVYNEEDYTCPCALVVGNEGKGISRLTLSKCDFTVYIPMRGNISSLNASVAASIMMYEVVKQRQK